MLWFVSCCCLSVNISNIPFSHVPLYIYTHHRLNNDGVRVSGDAKLFVDASVLDDTGRAHAVGAIAANDAGADNNRKEVDIG